MSISSATKSLAEDIQASHATRIAGISDIVQETHQNLDNFKRTQQERANTLRNELSSSERERAHACATFMGEIKDEIATLERDTNQMLMDFRHNLQEQTEVVRSALSSAERERRQEFATFRRNLRAQLAHSLTTVATDHRQARAQWEHLRSTRRTVKRVRH
jgi:hypothetical protein